MKIIIYFCNLIYSVYKSYRRCNLPCMCLMQLKLSMLTTDSMAINLIYNLAIIIQMCRSSALPQPVMLEWEAITRHRFLGRYGMTEVSTVFFKFIDFQKNLMYCILLQISFCNKFLYESYIIVSMLEGERKADTVGKPLLGVQVS